MLDKIVPQAYAQCDPSAAGLNLGDCLLLDQSQPDLSVGDIYSDPATLVDILVRNLFIVAGIFLLFILLYAGFKFIYQGTKGKDEAKQIMETAIIGFIVMFSAYWIVQIIRILTGIETFGL